jgi:hypothetical protein
MQFFRVSRPPAQICRAHRLRVMMIEKMTFLAESQ